MTMTSEITQVISTELGLVVTGETIVITTNNVLRGPPGPQGPIGPEGPQGPSDISEYPSFQDLPVTGEINHLYITTQPYTSHGVSTQQFRWTGTEYAPIMTFPESTDWVPEGASNQYFSAPRVRNTLLTGLSIVTSALISATDTVLGAFEKLQAQVTGKVNSDDLASEDDPNKGSTLVSYLARWSNAVARFLTDKLGERVSPFDFGAKGNANYWSGQYWNGVAWFADPAFTFPAAWYEDAAFTIPATNDGPFIMLALSHLASINGGTLDLCGRRFLAHGISFQDKYITIRNGALIEPSVLVGPDNQVPDGFTGGMQDWRDMFTNFKRIKFEYPFKVTTTAPNRRYDPRPSGNNAIILQRSALVTVEDCDFINCDACVSSVAKDVFQHVRQYTIIDNRINYCNYVWKGNYVEGGANLLQHGDCNVSNNMAIPCLITHYDFVGQDGGIVEGNTCFFPSYPFNYSVKKQNISLRKCAHMMVEANNLFEAGEEGIILDQCGRNSLVGNQIIWPGQRLESSGILYKNGSLSSDEFMLSTVGVNVIWDATKYGIEFGAGCGHAAVGTNIIRGSGTTTFYYGPAKVFPVGYAIYAPNTSKKINSVGNISDTVCWFASVGGWYSANIESPDSAVSYARTKSSKLTLTSTAITIDVTHYDTVALQQPSAVNVLNFVFTGDFAGLPSDQMDRELTLIAFNGNSTIVHGAFVKLKGGVNRTLTTTNPTMKLRYFAGIWYEV